MFSAAHLEQALASTDSPMANSSAFIHDANFTIAPVSDDATINEAVLEFDPRRNRFQRVGLRSVWYLPPPELAASGGSPSVQAEFIRKQSSTLDHFSVDLLKENSKIALLFAGFRVGGLFRSSPGHNLSASFPGYDPRQRGWYRAAEAARMPIYSDPYIGAGGMGWMITIAAPILTYAHNGSTGLLQGVVGADVTVRTIQEQVRATRAFE